ncbi:MAG: hypothetical protein CMH50_13185 [Myxococcales bacterium]|nr:hypothetical protein [Myxococcales bacterium]
MMKTSAKMLSLQQRANFEAMRLGACALGDEQVFRLAVDHGVAAALAAAAAERGDSLPAIWQDRLRQVRAQQLQQRSSLNDLLHRLEGSGAQWMTARGWARTVDTILPVRPMGDVDLYTSRDQLSKLSAALMPRWQLKNRPDDSWGTTRLFLDQEENGLAVDVHLDLSLFGLRRPGAIEKALRLRRRVHGLWLPDAETDWLIALVESLHGLRQRSLRRHWEREGLGERLSPNQRRKILQRFGFRSEILYQLERQLYRDVSERHALRWAAVSWMNASTSRLGTLAWLIRPSLAALWFRSQTLGRHTLGSS